MTAESRKMHPENEVDKETKDSKEMTELEKYWQNVKDNPTDFIGWTYLLQYVEQENNMENAREAFDSFFRYYPYCYGYWKKYADMEKKHDNLERAEQVFERGVEAIPLSVDLWIHYINFCKSYYKDDPDYYSKVKKIFERSVLAAGKEFRSDRLWDLYISWEQEQNNLKEVTAIYDRLLTIPTQLYSHHFEKFQEHVQKNLPKDILSTDEFLQMRKQFIAKCSLTDLVDEDSAADDVNDDLPPGIESEDKKDGVVQNEEETKFIREKVIEARTTIFKQNEEEVSKRWAFEEGIKRPYFHVKPLERTQLRNWREYLDFEIQNSPHENVVVLFERCLIACALYEDLWMKYARYMEAHGIEAVRDVYRRACTIHLIKKPNINMMWAAYEERNGNYDEAVKILSHIETTMPDLLEATLRKINLERRRGNYEQVELLYSSCISKAKTARMASHFAAKYARFLYKVKGDFIKAIEVLREAITKDSTNGHLYMQLIDVNYQQTPIDMEAIVGVFDSALASEMSAEQKLTFSQRKLEFLEDFGNDPFKIQDAFDEYTKLLKSHFANRKRAQDETEEAPKEKKPKAEINGTIVAPTVVSTTAVTADSAAYSYQQTWPASYTQGAAAAAAYAGYPQSWSGYPASYYQTQ